MSLQKRLVAVVALLLVVGLVVADLVTYASVHSFLYGQADNTLAQNESLGFNYVTYAAERGVPVTQAGPVAARRGRRVRAVAGPLREAHPRPSLGSDRPIPTRPRS